MISFWISVVPPKMDRALNIIGHALFITGKATAPTGGYSRSLAAPAAWSRASSAVRAGHGSGPWVVPSSLGGRFLSALVLSSASRVWIVRA